MEQLYVQKPIYPLVSLGVSLSTFGVGLLVAKDLRILLFLGIFTVIYLLFGYGKVLGKATAIFGSIGIIVGGLSMLSTGDFYIALQTFGRIILLAYSSVIMVALEPIYLTRNLVQLKFPRVISLGMLITMRFIPVLIEEIKQIKEAMKTRGIHIRLFDFSSMYRAFLIPFLMRMISLSDVMAISMETRGFEIDADFQKPYKEVRFTPRDGIFIILVMGMMIGVLIW
jgi:energy-coupling factor transport system permease protein